jgi:hypothetical protein
MTIKAHAHINNKIELTKLFLFTSWIYIIMWHETCKTNLHMRNFNAKIRKVNNVKKQKCNNAMWKAKCNYAKNQKCEKAIARNVTTNKRRIQITFYVSYFPLILPPLNWCPSIKIKCKDENKTQLETLFNLCFGKNDEIRHDTNQPP